MAFKESNRPIELVNKYIHFYLIEQPRSVHAVRLPDLVQLPDYS